MLMVLHFLIVWILQFCLHWSSPLSGHEALAFYIAKIPNVTVIQAVHRATMSHISRIVVVSNCRAASTDVPALVNGQTVLPGVQTVQGSIYNARFWVCLCEPHNTL